MKTALTQQHWAVIGKLNDAEGTKEFEKVASQLIGNALHRCDPIECFLIAEHSSRRKHWLAVAQIYIRLIVNCPLNPKNSATFSEQIGEALNITHNSNIEITNHAEFILYCFRQISIALAKDNITGQQQEQWIRYAIYSLLSQPHANPEFCIHNVGIVSSNNNLISKRFVNVRDHYNGTIVKYVRTYCADPTIEIRRPVSGLQNLLLLLVSISIILGLLFFAWSEPVTNNTGLLIGNPEWLTFAAIMWGALLVITWLFGAIESIRTRSFSFVSPLHYMQGRSVTFGEIVPFRRDWFFHIFQFAWLPFLFIAIHLFKMLDTLPLHLSATWNSENSQGLTADQYLETISARREFSIDGVLNSTSLINSVITSDLFALSIGFLVALLAIYNQERIQRRRIASSTNMYWWDRRISRNMWFVRCIMVGTDMMLGIAIIIKIIGLSYISYELINTDFLQIQYFSPDGVGGLKFISNLFDGLSWMVFLFGLFVMASLYLHWNLSEYKTTDFTLTLAYAILVVLIILPFWLLENRFAEERDALFAHFYFMGGKVTIESISGISGVVRNMSILRDWDVSAFNIGLFSGPIIPLLSQSVIILIQYVTGSKNKGSVDMFGS